MKTLAVLCTLLFAPEAVDVTAILGKLERWLDLQLATPTDAGQPVDAGKPDAGKLDAGPLDAGPADSGVKPDAGQPDSGHPPQPATGVFKVNGRKLFDPNGNEFNIRGTNKCHIDSWAQGLGQVSSNTTRWLIDPEPWLVYSAENTIKAVTNPNIGGSTTNGQDVAIIGMWAATCSSDAAAFEKIVGRWVNDAAKYQAALGRFALLNIANEFGNDEIAWRNSYVTAVPRIRAAGWRGTIVVDAPGCGQNGMAIVRYGQAILASDPDRNVMFDVHGYGLWYDSQGGIAKQYQEQLDLVPTMDALYQTGLSILLGEFGPGRNIGPSPTMITPQRFISLAEERGFHWSSWAWDDWNGANETADDNGFGHVRQGNSSTNLTIFGGIATDHWSRLAMPASVFGPAVAATSLRAAAPQTQPKIKTGAITKRFNMKLTPVRQ